MSAEYFHHTDHANTDHANTDRVCHICVGCGTQFAPTWAATAACPICTDDRQYVDPAGQRWTTHAELAVTHRARIEYDGEFLGIGIDGRFAIPQRALVAPSSIGNILWDCTSLVSGEVVAAIEQVGGVSLMAISHPHFYASMVEWSEALGGVPIFLHAADAEWVMRPSPLIEQWTGERLELAPDTTLVHLPGHFPGSAAMHRTDVSTGRSALLAGDSLHVAQDRRHVSVMHSVPNHVPVGPAVIRELRRRLEGLTYDDLYGFTWGLDIIGGASDAVDASLDRYLAAITDGGRVPSFAASAPV